MTKQVIVNQSTVDFLLFSLLGMTTKNIIELEDKEVAFYCAKGAYADMNESPNPPAMLGRME